MYNFAALAIDTPDRHKPMQAYQDLPAEYKDKLGLFFSRKPLSQKEIDSIFGEGLLEEDGNQLLRILHGRRVAGTLEDPAFSIHTARFSKQQIQRGLEYLRRHIKVDEVLNAGLRAEDELSQLEGTPAEEPTVKTGADALGPEVKPDPSPSTQANAGDTKEVKQDVPVPEVKPDPVYGLSVFDQIRARNQAKEKVRLARIEEEKQRAIAEGRRLPDDDDPRARSLVEVDEGQRAITNPKIAKYHREAMGTETEAPEMSVWQRTMPSIFFYVLTIGFLASLTMVYTEPEDKYRLCPEISPAVATIATIVAINSMVMLLWRIPQMWKWMNRYMILVVGKPRPITIFTANFSHQMVSHFLLNMAVFSLIGVHLHEDLGRMGFIALLMAAGGGGFLGALIGYSYKGMLGVTSLGASASTVGIGAAYFWDHRNDRFRIWGMPQDGVHGIVWWALGVSLFTLELFNSFAKESKSDTIGHWAGLVIGMCAIELMNMAGLGRKKGDRPEVGNGPGTELVKDILSGEEKPARK
ncbi:Rhomboid protein-like protein [Emericellopsis cladophorae]|uniref:Rhomboid protein-like protein n=1 Tax=Emericellopsis cladophorae TaxID=2686198 RepID=A0A9P9Y9P2_9HYPO|nr:Rhomboid protein-like protein [Emericellopsis cladophorae]KAI6785595.1 Rhomboid protein-like protein [Emericellopsis cladophorae]